MVCKINICKCCVKKNIEFGIVYICFIFNNMIVMIIDIYGNVLVWLSVGFLGFKGFCKFIFFVV